MTAALHCDGCGRVVSLSDPSLTEEERDDPARSWWELTRGPAVGGSGLLSPLKMDLDLTVDEDHPLADVEPAEVPPVEPERHFCSDDCLCNWIAGKVGA